MNGQFVPPRIGTSFDERTGKLYMFYSDSISVLVAWPEPRAWRKTEKQPAWRSHRPRIVIPSRDLSARIAAASVPQDATGQYLLGLDLPSWGEAARRGRLVWLRWFDTIPQEVRAPIARIRARHWHLLSLAARCGEAAKDLIRTNPALAFALASSWVFRPPVTQPMRSARALLARGKKQRDILAWLGFPSTEAARKVLKKVHGESINVLSLLYLRQGMAVPEVMKLLSHLSRVNAGVIRIATDQNLRGLVAPSLLEEIAMERTEDRTAHAAYILRDIRAMVEQLGDVRPLPVIRSLPGLAALHDSLVDDVNEHGVQNRRLTFPPPPLPGTAEIIPITSARELAREGREQHNCAVSYADRVAVGRQVYVYRVLLAERCTLAVARVGGRWVLAELARAHNQKPARDTRIQVERWIAEANERSA